MGETMMDEYLLTVIMSNYNQEQYLPQAIESVLSQIVNFKYKLIIADDYSCDDRSKDIIKDYADRYDNIEVIFANSNGGYLTNILRAKERTKTKYFCLLDADDYWTDMHFLQRAIDFLSSHDEYAIYESNVMIASVEKNGNEKIKKTFVCKKLKSGTYSKEQYFNNESIPLTQTTGMVFRNNIFANGIPVIMSDAIGTRSERSFEGEVGRFIMHLKTGLVYYDDSIIGVYRVTPNGIWSKLSNPKKQIITAHLYQDLYCFHESNADFFVNKTYGCLQGYFIAKQNELSNKSWQEECIDEYERLMLGDVNQFCNQHKSLIVPYKKGIKHKLKQIIKVLLS